jgi:hypothetical protein
MRDLLRHVAACPATRCKSDLGFQLVRLWGRWQRLVERRTLEASKLRERTIKLRNLADPRRHDALDISHRTCAKLLGKIIQHTFECAFELVFEFSPLVGDCLTDEPVDFGKCDVIDFVTARRSRTV